MKKQAVISPQGNINWIAALLPLVLLGLVLLFFLNFGPLDALKSTVAPIENIFIQKVIFSEEHLTVEVFNDGPQEVTISQVMVNDAFWQFEMNPKNTLSPLQKAKVEIDYPWLEGDFTAIKLVSSNGIVFTKEIEVAKLTPQFNWFYLKNFVLLGIFVGVIPILLGLLWLPFLQNLKEKWYNFLLAMTVGLLVFLGIDAFAEALQQSAELPSAFNGIGILVIGFLLAVFVLSAVSFKTRSLSKEKGEHVKALVYGYLIALGIGLHNLGEGLAIGSAYAVGEVALGSLLVIGFMVHNVTEGVAIIAPVARMNKLISNFYLNLVLMGLLAGIPTIIGAIIGGFSHSFELSVFFLAVGSGAIFDVAFDIMQYMSKGDFKSFFTATNVLGFFAGMSIMYFTGFLVLG